MTKSNSSASVQGLFDFIKKSPTSFHAVARVSETLIEKGFLKLSEGESWELLPGKKYFVTRNSSSLIAFTLPESKEAEKSFMMVSSHSDSPSFKIKENQRLEN